MLTAAIQVVKYLPHESLTDVALDILLLATIECVFRNAVSNLLTRPHTIRVISVQYSYLINLCAVLHVLHHTPFVLIVFCILSVLWRILAACSRSIKRTVNYHASKELMYKLEPNMQTKQFHWNAGRQAVFQDLTQLHSRPSDHVHSLLPTRSPRQRRIGCDYGSLCWAPSSGSIHPLGHTPSIRCSPLLGSSNSPSYVSKLSYIQSLQTPRATGTSTTPLTKERPTSSSWHTPSIQPHITFKEPKKSVLNNFRQESRHDKHVMFETLVQPDISVEINQPPGIPNYGNTCFFNAGIQCLSCSGGFLELFEKAPSDNNGLIQALVTTITQCRDKRVNVVDPRPLLRAIARMAPNLVSVTGNQCQQDASELVAWILNAVSEQYKATLEKTEAYRRNKQDRLTRLTSECEDLILQLRGAKTNNIYTYKDAILRFLEAKRQRRSLSMDHTAVDDMCTGAMVRIHACQECLKMSFFPDQYILLPLPVVTKEDDHANIHLQESFIKFTGGHTLDEFQQCTCCCEPRPHRQWFLLYEPLPQKLLLLLPRFDYASGSRKKLSVGIAFPLAGLDLTPFLVETQFKEPGTHKPPQLYDLSAFCVHTGSEYATSGHYIAYCKLNPSEQWYCFNDSVVTPVDIEEIGSEFVLRNAYLLFYSKRV